MYMYSKGSGLAIDKAINPGPAKPEYALPFTNNVDQDQVASEKANWSRCTLYVIQYVNLYQQPGSSNLIGWKTKWVWQFIQCGKR